ncbi:ATP-binding protein [Microlunatus flavus]|uniref:AAA-like domain-containing protein n=1 Tax=Microlunatus flavus TaxID=1036181 RepID=A0A1H9MVI4_9ACTN|nr:ATP-binding protein [Microlunatus flavus]SER27716.1 hypothetical protein SAMN05421756_11198 [Microlunatus flavus]
MTSDQAPVLWPLIAGQAPPATGALMGWDLGSGGLFHADPAGWVLDPNLPVANPNVFVFGKPGRGKSATIKALILRMADLGHRTLVLGDPKDEYAPLCRALGVEPVDLGPGLPARLNPYDTHATRPGDQAELDATIGHWVRLTAALVGAARRSGGRAPVTPTDTTVVTHALRDVTGVNRAGTRLAPVTVPLLWQRLAQPTQELIDACSYADARHFLDETRLLRDSLGQLVTGTLAGLFDAPTTVRLDPDAPIQSLSLARLNAAGDDAVGTALLCLNAWAAATRPSTGTKGSGEGPGRPRLVVRDEAWKQLRLGVDAVAAFDADLRLSRSTGDIQIAVAHKPSDLLTAGDTGSQAVEIARDLLHLTDIRILHGQDPATADDLDHILGLGPVARQAVTGWAMHGTGRAVWCLGPRLHRVQTVLHPLEQQLYDTNSRLRDGRNPSRSSSNGSTG